MDLLAQGFSARLRERRKSLGLSQSEVGASAKLSGTNISHFEVGTRKPSMKNLIALADALNCSADYLLLRADNPGSTFVGLERVFRRDERDQ